MMTKYASIVILVFFDGCMLYGKRIFKYIVIGNMNYEKSDYFLRYNRCQHQ